MHKGHIALTTLVAATVISGADLRAQQPPPIHGVTGTIATEESIKDTTEAGGTIFSKAKRLFHLNRKNQTGDVAGDEALRGLKKGTAVTLGDATDSKQPIEGAVTEVNRDDQKIFVKLADGTQQTFRLSDRAERDTAGAVVVYYTNAAGQRVALDCKRVR